MHLTVLKRRVGDRVVLCAGMLVALCYEGGGVGCVLAASPSRDERSAFSASVPDAWQAIGIAATLLSSRETDDNPGVIGGSRHAGSWPVPG